MAVSKGRVNKQASKQANKHIIKPPHCEGQRREADVTTTMVLFQRKTKWREGRWWSEMVLT